MLTGFLRLMVNDDIEAIIHHGEERTVELNTKYEGLNFEDLTNFKSEASVQQWEGEDFRTGVSTVRSSLFEFTIT
jgi:SWI/SNF-related matrix-associated actin-dependent regulator of chromatin subfamily A member 5